MRIAVLWSRFGPYHLARLAGVAAIMNGNGEVMGIEIAGSDETYAWDIAKDIQGIERVTLFPDCTYESLASRAIATRIHQALDVLNPRTVAVNGWAMPEARAAIGWCRRNDARCILMSETKEDDISRVWWKEVGKRRIVQRCHTALVGGRSQTAYLRKLGFKGKIFLGYDVVDNRYFQMGAAAVRAQAAQVRQRFGLPDRYFFACTRFIARKNVGGLLKAYATYRTRCTGEPWGLVIAGSGQEAENLHQLERELGIGEIVWPGFVQYDALPSYYGLASAFIHPALAEPWGLVVNEALASGLPVLLSHMIGARHELLVDGKNGYAFDPSDYEDLARKMLMLADMDDGERAHMSSAAHQIIADWTPKRFAEGLLAAAS